ncbi:hypothetical protein [Paracidovorax avenae]|uniref:hypothetical protein n=1 Tax=Paracidovorax avenae TaxID=80867 RepID=UPI000D20436D|nr:hypothetical protein [Paracidovorax avenae]AVS95089.1 hypothetical protein C8232_01540 [Paracidovorax avenae]AVT01545.1 hypothetical protein C8243_02870 [Paracidovorax avenae]AVT08643.1 hypothetical protein C8242_03360 [Paracidovorax avenae]
MNLLPCYDEAIGLAKSGDFSGLDSFFKQWGSIHSSGENRGEWLDHMLPGYGDLDVSIKAYLLDALVAIDMEAACRLAEKDLETAYWDFRWSGGDVHLHLSIMAQMEGAELPTVCLNYNQNMAMASAVLGGSSLRRVLHDQAQR